MVVLMSVYRPGRGKRKVIEEVLRDLDPATRDLARVILENIMKEEAREISPEELLKHVDELKKKRGDKK